MKRFLFGMMFLSVVFMSAVNAENKPSGGLDHIGLSVSKLDASTDFFVNVLGFKVFGRDSKYPAAFLNNGEMSLTLWQTADDAVAFDRKNNVGLHHLAIKVASFEALDDLYKAIDSMPEVVIEFAPELFYGGPAKHMMIREPSGNRIELIHRPSKN